MSLVQNKAPKAISLYCTEGSSDKVYQASLREAGDGGWLVDFAYGKRGTALKTGTKTSAPIAYEQAVKLFDRLVNEKTGKGYTVEESGVAYTSSEHQKDVSGHLPQLPTAIDEQMLSLALEDDAWCLQEKKDGENRMLLVNSGNVRGINRKGLFVDIPITWVQLCNGLPDCLIAGEAVGRIFHAFDLLEYAGRDMRNQSFSARFNALANLFAQGWFHTSHEPTIMIVPMATGGTKRSILDAIRGCNGEGGVFKRLDGLFEQGRSRTQFKYKFVESATFIVLRQNTQRSVGVGLFDIDGKMVDLGNVSIPENFPVPAVNSLVEVRYLYRFENGMLEQPVYLGPRNDIDRADAVIGQIGRIKVKSCSEA